MYDETLSEALLNAAACLMQFAAAAQPPREHSRPPPVLVVALEKRFCFTLRDMDSRAPAFDHFLSLIDLEPMPGAPAPAADPAESRHAFIGRRIDPDHVPQRLQGYERGPDLELWELRLK